MDINDLSYKVRGSIYEVHKHLGNGLLESAYETALLFELESRGIKAEKQVEIPVYYKENLLDIGFRADIIVEDCIVLELKSVVSLEKVHFKQLLNYLKLTNLKLGYLVNFNVESLVNKISFVRIVN